MGCPHAATGFAGSSISHHLIIFRCQFGTVLLYRDTGGTVELVLNLAQVGSCCLFPFVCLTQKFIKRIALHVSRRDEAAVGYVTLRR